jgi:hypothetical protein
MRDIQPTIENTPNSIDQLIERWWEDHFPGSAIARDTTSWNIAHAAKETLKRLLDRVEGAFPKETGGENLRGSI